MNASDTTTTSMLAPHLSADVSLTCATPVKARSCQSNSAQSYVCMHSTERRGKELGADGVDSHVCSHVRERVFVLRSAEKMVLACI